MKFFARCLHLAGAFAAADVCAATFTVVNTNNADGGSLRKAILDANAAAGADVIEFQITNLSRAILVSSNLPVITDPLTINGTTQPGYLNAPIVELSGGNIAGGLDGLKMATSNSTVRALVIRNFTGDGIEILGGSSNVVEGCYLGLNLAGTSDQGVTFNGILISNAPNTRIGGTTDLQRNVISGNNQNGVYVFGLNATNTMILGNYIGQNAAGANNIANGGNGVLISNVPLNRVGGVVAGERNVISGNSGAGVRLEGTNAFGNLILGNYLGLDAPGAADRGNSGSGVHLFNAPGNTIGGTAAGAGNVLSGNGGSGVRLENTNSFDNLVLGNTIGLDALGTTTRGNDQNGVHIVNAPSNTVGGVTGAAQNMLCANNNSGVRIEGVSARWNLVQGNIIGTDTTGTLDRGNANEGVLVVSNARDNFIGGAGAGEANVIAFNDGDGVGVAAGTNNAIRLNSIYLNFGLGLDLGPSGIQPNDNGDPDGGANQFQNYPILSTASNTASSVTIAGSLHSRPSATYTLDFFSTQLSEPGTNFAEGQFYLGSTNVTTGADSNAVFTVTFPVAIRGRLITATATDSTNNTSEFSPYVASVSVASPLTFTVTTTNDSGAGSLRQAIHDSNARVSSTNNTISFEIPGAGVRVIAPPAGLPLPPVVEPVILDGFTQSGSSSNSLASGNNAVWLVRLSGGSTGTGADGLVLVNSGNAVRGLIITSFNGEGIEVSAGSSNNVISGNCLGLDENGTDLGNGGDGILINGSRGNRIGGTAPADRNIISGNNSDGVELSGLASSNNLILGNIIGPDPNGLADRGNNSRGVFVNGAPNNTIGGAGAGAGNLISGNSPNLEINGVNSTNNFVFGNLIGPDLTGNTNLSAPVSSTFGIHFSGNARFNFVGGTNAGAGNVIAFNGSDGVYVQAGTNNAIRANNIFSNSALGIDLDPDNVTANDGGDLDTGSNQRQNYPVITNALLHLGSTLIQGFLNSRTNSTYFLDFFASFLRDTGSTNGEGQAYLGSATVTTGADSNANFSVALPVTVTAGRWITATATDTNGNTSEFSTAFGALSTKPAAILTVVNTNHSGSGSLRQAILDNNSTFTASNNMIRFQIPGAGGQTIFVSNALPAITEPVTIDGYTQTGAQTNSLTAGNDAVLLINLNGVSAGSGVDGLRLEAVSNIVRGLIISRFQGDGIEVLSGFNRIEGNFIGVETGNAADLGNNGNGVLITGATNNTIGGATPSARNVISDNGNDGIEINGAGASNNVVLGNFIGTDLTGTLDDGNDQDGVFLNSAPNNTIGGTTAAARNVIAGNGSEGITMQSTTASNNFVLNNYIGTDVGGTQNLGNSSHGVLITSQSPSGNVIGSPNPGGNTIAFNNGDGIYVQNGTNNAIRANNIWSNGSLTISHLGIDLGSSGVLLNDSPDLPTGANLQQNYPVLSNAIANPATTFVQGTLSSRASMTYQIDFFSSIGVDPSGFGEGQKYLGTTNVTTDALGGAAINATLTNVVLGRFITATATDPNGNSSEFSPAVRASSTIPPVTFVVTNTLDFGPGSLRRALENNNTAASSTNNLITFAIPGTGPFMVSPQTPLPVPTEAVTIDGYTQPAAATNSLTGGNNAVILIRLDGNGFFNQDGLRLTAIGGNIVRGLSITRFNSDGIELGTNGSNTVEGCFIGLEPDGVTLAGNQSFGINAINSPNNVIGGGTPAARNLISANTQGVNLSGAGATNNRVQGNYIGTDKTGTLDRGNNLTGVLADNARLNFIGGTNALTRNLISGNGNYGVLLSGSSEGNLVQGNWIGSDVAGTGGIPNSVDGIQVNLFGGTGGNLIGGTNAGAGNRIMFNLNHGIVIASGTNNPIFNNLVYSNGNLGIDLGFDGNITANDPGDPDTGGNQLQNFPLLTNATITPVSTFVAGTLNSRPNTAYLIQVFANVFRDPVYANGEGQQFLGATNLTTGADSNATFNVTLPVPAIGRHLTATATDPSGNTSEFSPSFAAASTFPPVTFVVTNTLDFGPGSLRQAIQNNNATASASNIITFNIAGPGPHFIAPTSALPAVVERVFINGFSQPGAGTNSLATGNNAALQIVLTGTNAGFSAKGLTFSSSSNLVRGLNIIRFSASGLDLPTAGNVVEGCLIGLGLDSSLQGNAGQGFTVSGPGNRIGGTSPGSRNVISANNSSGIYVSSASASNNVIQGNFIGTDLLGTTSRGNGSFGIELQAANTLIGGSAVGAGNVIGGNFSGGVNVSFASESTAIRGNRIGISFADTIIGSSGTGVLLANGSAVVGGTLVAERNIISGNNSVGVQTSGSATNVSIIGNYIGTDGTGNLPVPNSSHGVALNANGARVGGVAPGEANVIAFNGVNGVNVGFGTNSTIRANQIFSNGFLGIDLGSFGVTPNDGDDSDPGANNLQNFPILSNAVAHAGNTFVQGTLTTRPGGMYQLDFFANDAGDASGFGEGQRYLGSTNLTTDASGNVAINFTGAALVSGRFITATATSPNGDTSEFSPWITAASTVPGATFTVINTNDSGPGSLRQALLDVALLPNAGNDVINFAIPGTGVRTIAPLTTLPTPLDPVTINGFSQVDSQTNSLINGNNAVILIRLDGTNLPFGGMDGLNFTNHNNVVRGLEILRFGGVGIELNASRSNVIAGNLIWSNSFDGVFSSGGSGNRIGGLTPGERNVISANFNYGIQFRANTNSAIQGNFVGTDFTGTSDLGNGAGGVLLDGGSANLIGPPGGGGSSLVGKPTGGTGGPDSLFGNPAVVRNVISGNGSSGSGIGIGVANVFTGVPLNNRIFGNLIGSDVTGALPVPNASLGVSLSGAVGTTVGGTNANEPNLIAFNGSDAVAVIFVGATNNTIQANSMFSNGVSTLTVGIDLLGNNGITANDLGDGDTGPNQLQNFPSLTNATISSSNITVQGMFQSAPAQSYRLDFYANVFCDNSGNGEGKHWLGSATVMTGADSNATFSVNLPLPPEGTVITATATDASGNTSEYCACRAITIPPLLLTVINTNDSGPGSLRAALQTNNASSSSSPNELRFNIPGTNVQTIALMSPLPEITRSVIIDGFTQAGSQTNQFINSSNTGVWKIRLDGTSAGTNNVDALHFTSSSNTVRGLCIVNFTGDGIELEGGIGSVIEQNLLGIDVLPTSARFAGRGGDHDSYYPPGFPPFTAALLRGININGSAQNLILNNFLGLITLYAIYIHELQSYANYLFGNIVGRGPNYLMAPVGKNAVFIKDGFDTLIEGGGFSYIGRDAVRTRQLSSFTVLANLWFFDMVFGQLHDLGDRGRGIFESLVSYPQITSATPGGYSGTQFGSSGGKYRITVFALVPVFPIGLKYIAVDEFDVTIPLGNFATFNRTLDPPLPPGTPIRAYTTCFTESLVNLIVTSEDSPDYTVTSSGAQPPTDLAITKTSSPNPVPFGSNLVYTLTVTNRGPNAATNVVVSDTLPAGLVYDDADTPQGSTARTGQTVRFDLGTITNGQSLSMTIEVTVNVTNPFTFTNLANVTSISSPDPVPTNNSATNLVSAVPPADAPELEISYEVGQVVLRWNGVFTLQCAPTVTGVYTNVPGATSPHSVNPAAVQRSFYRLSVP